MLDGEADDALQFGLGDVNDPAASDMLAQKHTEIRSGHGRCLVLICQVHKGERGVRTDKEALLPRGGFYGKEKLVCLRLDDLRDSSV